MDGDLYDEFGNYLGSDSEQEEVFEVANAAEAAAPQPETVSGVLDDAGMLPGPSHAVRDIVLHEDKAYYEDARQTFGDGVGTFFCLVYLVIDPHPVQPSDGREQVLQVRVPDSVQRNCRPVCRVHPVRIQGMARERLRWRQG